MFNPYVKFQKPFIEKFRQIGNRYLVAQTFTREDNLFKQEDKTYLLLTHYKDKGKALEHQEAAAHYDQASAMIDLENTQEREDLYRKFEPDANYVFYSSLISDPNILDQAVNKLFADKIKKYIDYKKKWTIGRDQHVRTFIDSTFGEMYVNIHHGSLKARPKLQEIENL